MSESTKKQPKPIKQHWVPRFYLKEFATLDTRKKKESQVWIFSKEEGDPTKVNIKDIAAKRYLYSPKDENGERCWKMEDELASLESLMCQIWPDFANSFIDLNNEAFRKGISLFLATMLLRHPKRLNEYDHLQKQMIDFYDSLPKDENGNPMIGSIKTKEGVFEFDSSDWGRYSNPKDYDKQKFFVDTIKSSAIEIAEMLMKKRWSVVFSESEQFITSDNPLIISNRLIGEMGNYGLNTKGTEITFPISPTRVLIMDDMFEQPHSQYYSLQGDTASAINLKTWLNVHQFMITHRNPDEVNYEMMKFLDKRNVTI
ncbi:DUF4238 domain-containing protein [Sulfurimonas sp. HSL-1656]|uniref:DUF4238 domain-containing protein n=1 Tax=Thiomicrolovo subterrani TaxID=3131934 RepID=UPI0031F94A34